MITPANEAELSDALRSANGPVSIRGGGTRGVKTDGMPLSVSAMSGITLYEPGALTLVAQAGTPVMEVEEALAKEGQRLAFEPMDHRTLLGTKGTPTLGGIVAGNVSGPRRIQGGAARDYTLGVRLVDGAGTIIKNGGRVMKNVTGYDLVKLMTGAYGTLGVLTEVALKVLPVPETQATLMLRALSDADAVRAMAVAMSSPYEVSGAAHCARISKDGPVTLLRLEGFEDSVNYRLAALRTLLKDHVKDMHVADGEASAWMWESVRDASLMSQDIGDIWRVACKASDAAVLADKSGAEAWYFDWAGGLIWFRTRPGFDLRNALGPFDGHATLVRATKISGQAPLPRFHPEAAGVARLSAGLRARFDPKGILNPGLMGPVAPETV